ncbi:WD40 repeat-containing protein [Candidatus Protofrankia californiensis]|uniref:WD40 repeat-containing protein n=1 Tax=Candidatus Protofrankia californiensis TaxID=1839754 RepID=A0A1C3NY71_9ACTN|nr:WD40 repeat-containing protein [Candidatus Protofrankia californiensis]
MNPRMLSFIAELPEDDLLAACAPDGTVSAADLYARLVARWLENEVARRQPSRGSFQTLTVGQLRQAVDALAVMLWESGEDATDLAELSDTVRATLTDLGKVKLDATQAAFIVGSGSLLVRRENRFSFVHRSIMEFLTAAVTARQLDGGHRASSLLARRNMSQLMIDFLVGLADQDALGAWAQRVLTDREDTAGASPVNALRVARALGLPVDRARLAGQDLRGQNLSGRNLRFADLTGAVLAGIRLPDADLTGADLTGADLTGARLIRPVLTNVRLTGSRWQRAALLHPQLDTDSAATPELAAAAILGRDRVEAMLLPPAQEPRSIAFAPDGTVLAACWGQQVLLVDPDGPRPLRTLTGHTAAVRSVAFSPDGTTLATGGDDHTIRLWEAATGQQTRRLSGHTGAVRSVAFSPDGTTLATGSDDGTVQLWDATGRPGNRRPGNRRPDRITDHTHDVHEVQTLAFSPDGTTLATGSDDGTVQLWDVISSRRTAMLTGHTGAVWSVVFSPDGTTLATGGDDHTIRLWEAATGQQTAQLTRHTDHVHAVAFSPDGTTLATGSDDGTVQLWDVISSRRTAMLTGHTGAVRSVAFSPDGTTLATGGTDRTLRLWDPTGGQETGRLTGRGDPVWAVAFSPDGTTLATSQNTGHDTNSDHPTVRLWELATGRQTGRLTGNVDVTTAAGAVAFSPDGATLATVHADALLRWDVTTGRRTSHLAGHAGALWPVAVAFSPDPTIIATGGDDGTVRLWNITTGHQVGRLGGHTGPVRAIAFSPDPTIIATGGDDGTVRLWNITTGTTIATVVGLAEGGWSVLLPDGSAKIDGDPANFLWWIIKLCRLEPGELAPLALDAPIPGFEHIPHSPIRPDSRNRRRWFP